MPRSRTLYSPEFHQQMVELARAIADGPRLLLDEPTSGLSAGEAACFGLADTIAFMAADRSLLS